jgi:ubiquinone/menaquinone biosynthesis C-methylase UbiE
MTTLSTQDDETTLFRKTWTLYDAISEKNYMFHREIYAHVSDLLRQRSEYSLLDLGCGNARFLAPCLHAHPPASYDGVDLSAVALEEAALKLSGLPNVRWHETDMLEALQKEDRCFDVIFSSFAIHHLSTEDKQQLFHATARRLSPGGVLIMVDVVREEGQSREDYLDGYLGNMRTHWTAVPQAELEQACEHVASFDFPETLSDLTRMAEAAGFSKAHVVARFAQHHVLVFTRADA